MESRCNQLQRTTDFRIDLWHLMIRWHIRQVGKTGYTTVWSIICRRGHRTGTAQSCRVFLERDQCSSFHEPYRWKIWCLYNRWTFWCCFFVGPCLFGCKVLRFIFCPVSNWSYNDLTESCFTLFSLAGSLRLEQHALPESMTDSFYQ